MLAVSRYGFFKAAINADEIAQIRSSSQSTFITSESNGLLDKINRFIEKLKNLYPTNAMKTAARDHFKNLFSAQTIYATAENYDDRVAAKKEVIEHFKALRKLAGPNASQQFKIEMGKNCGELVLQIYAKASDSDDVTQVDDAPMSSNEPELLFQFEFSISENNNFAKFWAEIEKDFEPKNQFAAMEILCDMCAPNRTAGQDIDSYTRLAQLAKQGFEKENLRIDTGSKENLEGGKVTLKMRLGKHIFRSEPAKMQDIEGNLKDWENPIATKYWRGIENEFEPTNQMAARNILTDMCAPGRTANQDIESYTQLTLLAKPGFEKNMYIDVGGSKENLDAGRINLKMQLGEHTFRSESLHACDVVGSLMGWRNADAAQIKKETSAGEQALIAKCLTTIHKAPFTNCGAQRAAVSKAHHKDVYDVYRPREKRNRGEKFPPEPLHEHRYPLDHGYFKGDFLTKIYCLNQLHQNPDGSLAPDAALNLFRNIGYETDDQGAVKFSMIHYVINQLIQNPISALQFVQMGKTLESDKISILAAINSSSLFLDLMKTPYELYQKNKNSIDEGLLEIYQEHDNTLVISVKGQCRNQLPI